MELMDALRGRRAVREYTDAPLTRTVIDRLIEAATLAPSAMNLQPWSFAAILDRERVQSYGERARQWLIGNAGATGFGVHAHELLERPGFDIFYHAPALALVIAESSAAQAVEDCCLAAENLMLAARDSGIGSCWIGFARPWLNLKSVKEEFSLPGNAQIVAPIVLGYPVSWPETHGRKAPEIHWL